jgi:hypothetical protein
MHDHERLAQPIMVSQPLVKIFSHSRKWKEGRRLKK